MDYQGTLLMTTMKRTLKMMLAVFILLLFWADAGNCREKVRIYFFWGEGCPHCSKEKVFLDRITQKYPAVEIISLEVRQNRENALLFSKMASAFGEKVMGVPTTFIGDFRPVSGYNGDESTGADIEEKIRYCLKNRCIDPSSKVRGTSLLTPQDDILAGAEQPEEGLCKEDAECPEEEMPPDRKDEDKGELAGDKGRPEQEASQQRINIPLIGELDLSRTSLPLQTLVIAAMDSFNPCAFFVLFTLLGLLMHAHSRKKLLLIGGIFVFFSGFIYFLFMAAWLNIFLLTGRIKAVTMVAGITALIIAMINIKDYFFFKKGVSLTIPDSAKPKLFDRMRRLLRATSFSSVVLGTVVLAVAANAYELFCTAGFPMVYTRILTLHNFGPMTYYLYLALYNVIYIVPLASVVLVFAFTLGSKKLSEWQGQVLKLVSGMMMSCLGAVLMIDPDLLNNIGVTIGLFILSLAVTAVIVLLTKRNMQDRLE